MRFIIAHILFFTMGFWSVVCASDSIKTDQTNKSILKILPAAYYTPETRIAVEAFGYYTFKSKGAQRASNIRLFLGATQNRQVMLNLPWLIYTSRENLLLKGKVEALIFPEYYYGLGNYTIESNRLLYTFKTFGLDNSALWNLTNNRFLGFKTTVRLFESNLSVKEFVNMYEYMKTIGTMGYRIAGIGPTFIYDSRDNIICPSKGVLWESFAQINISAQNQMVSPFAKFSTDFRQYIPFRKKSVLAYQVFLESTAGEVPFRELPRLGGPFVHRGYYQGRFRDNHLVFAQAEWRQNMFWRVGTTLFGSLGRVYKSFDETLMTNYRPAAGAGLRFKLSDKDEANIRLDFAVTPDSRGFYIYFAEAF